MKQLLFLAAFALGSQTLHAQSIAAGTVSLGGSVGYNQNTSSGSSSNANSNSASYILASETVDKQVNISPAASYFVADNLAVGLMLGYYNTRRTESRMFAPSVQISGFNKTTSMSLRVGAFAQYYKMLTTQFGVTGRLGAGYQHAKQDRTGYSDQSTTADYYNYVSTSTSNGYYVDLTPGLIFFPVPKFGLSASIGTLSFNNYKVNDFSYNDSNGYSSSAGTDSKSSYFAADFGLNSFLLGGTYYFGR